MNLTQIMGHLGAEPEVRYTPSGLKVVSLRIASNARKAGKDQTIWWKVSIWGERYDKMLPYLKKGSAVIVMGEVHKPEIYTDRNGVQQVSLEITAEIVRFSPFGKPNTEGESQQQGQSDAADHYVAPFSAQAAHEGSNSSEMQYPAMDSPFGQGYLAAGKGQPKNTAYTEDNIPF